MTSKRANAAPSHWRRRAKFVAIPQDQIARQGNITRLALIVLGKEAAIAFLNTECPSIHVARLGGEEFALVGNVLDLTPNLASTILEDIQSAEMPHAEELTASIGMAFGTLERVGDWSELYGQADRALYAAKS